MSAILQELETLGRRFAGVSLSFRKSGTDWPKPCRAKLLASKNEREDYRITVYADTMEGAASELIRKVSLASGNG